ncbi:MAG: gamma-glutamyl-gamma-aminobutyrate hydrolase family protein [Bacteroidota bacterium]
MKSKITIGITDCSKFGNYEKWIQEEGADVIKLSYQYNNFEDIKKCDGIILSGGEDVHPRFYKKNNYLEYCYEIDEKRDDFEWKVLEHTEQLQLPLLGICRGLQVANVYFGGTLIPDIPSFGKFNHARYERTDRHHVIHVDPNSDLKKIVGLESGEINSAHHQSADLVGKDLVANAISPDGIIEGLERKNKEGKPYLMLVQWHPERMIDQQSVFSKNIRRSFLEAAKKGTTN